MKILYDNGAFCQTYGGVSRYYAEMMRHLPDDCQPALTMSSTYNRYLQAAPYSLPRMQQSVHDFVRDYCGGRYWPGAAEYFELDDAKSLIAAIERAKKRMTVEKGRERLKGFSWKKCAAETAAVYRRFAG